MRTLLAIGLSALLSGCGISNPILKSEIVSYDDVIESVTDKLLVLNILRARDQAPLHFMALPSLRQSITQNNSLSLLELTGPRNASTQRSTATLGMSFQVAPSFDLSHVYTKEFVTGMTSPIDPKYVKYWIDRGLDRRLVMLLFFSSAEITQGKGAGAKKVLVTNTPKESIEQIRGRVRYGEANHCAGKSQFERYISVVNKIKSFSAKISSKPKTLGCIQYDPRQPAKFLQALAAAEQAKLKYKYLKKSGTYKLTSASEESRVLFCLGSAGNMSAKAGDQKTQAEEDSASCQETDPADAGEDKDCPVPVRGGAAKMTESGGKPDTSKAALDAIEKEKDSKKTDDYCEFFGPDDKKLLTPEISPELKAKIEEQPDPEPNPDLKKMLDSQLKVQFTIRSVGEMIHFLGDLLYYQEALKSDPSLKVEAGQAGFHILNNPVTLGFCSEDELPKEENIPPTGIWDILFTLSDDLSNARFTVPYRDRTYGVGNYKTASGRAPDKDANRCAVALAYRKDHTLQVLSVVQQLTNLHQSATEIRATPTVQVVP